MAGIGFRLEKILHSDTYTDSVITYFYSTLIASGPWILSILTIFCLNYFKPHNIDYFEGLYFRTSFTYIFALSLIFSGAYYLSLSRYISDKLYILDTKAIVPIFNTSILTITAFQVVLSVAFVAFTEGEIVIKCMVAMIYIIITAIWVVFIFLTALRDYHAIAIAYCIGSAIAIGASLYGGRVYDLPGYFAGYFLGQLFILVALSSRVFIEFPSRRVFDRGMFKFMFQNKILVLTGLFYNLAVWIDKFVFWWSPRATKITEFYRVYPEYDSAIFLAYMTIIPSLSLFLMHIETDFFKKYRNYYNQILNRGTYTDIFQAKAIMLKSLRRSAAMLVSKQGMLSIVAIIFAPDIIHAFMMSNTTILVFRVTILGAFVHTMLLITTIIILYFDFQKLAFIIAVLFMVTNGLFTYFTTLMPMQFVGYGYVCAALITLMVAFYSLDAMLKKLEYITFALQPVADLSQEGMN